MKDPDCLHDAIRDAVKEDVEKVTGIFERERENLIEDRIEEVGKACARWFQWGEYLTVEIDTDAQTAIVIPK
jgi:dihydroneopterin aldolase